MRWKMTATSAVTALAVSAAPALAADVTIPGDGQDGPGFAVVNPRASLDDWDPLTDAKWAIGDGEVVLTEAGTPPPGPRRPFEYAIVTQGPEFETLTYRAEVRLDPPLVPSNHDVILIWNYQSPTRFYYAHLSMDNTIYPHNGIFVVNDADRLRIDDQWNGSIGAPPAITDGDWHDVRLDYDAETGRIEVFMDGSTEPLITASDTTFSGGRIGFGSFDNIGRARDIVVAGVRHR